MTLIFAKQRRHLVMAIRKFRSWLYQLNKRLENFEQVQDGAYQREAPIAKLRMAVCERCPALSASKRCNECGCYMPIKVYMKTAACPLGRWKSLEKKS